jgi:flavin reductase (DIM6/NTAB) family NADH-FMN oxidoreductase RutF
MYSLDPRELDPRARHGLLLGGVGPRPIAFASTIDTDGRPNLSPYSFFNIFSSNPPILIFSPSRRVRDNTTKHTLHNAQATREVVINVVNYDLVQQTSLSSSEYAEGVNEFVKAGLTPIASEKVKPFRVKESPVQFECKVRDIIPLGEEGGAGNLVICEVVYMHVNEKVMDANGKIDQRKIDLVARMGGDWYTRAHGESMFEVEKPLSVPGIGIDQMPKQIRSSIFLTGNDLGKLGNVPKLPGDDELQAYAEQPVIRDIISGSADGMEAREKLHQYAKELLEADKVEEAWKALLCDKLSRN